jgi:DNA polymerase I
MKEKVLFVFDVFPLLYRAKFAMISVGLKSSKGMDTAPILGFCNYLFQVIFKERPTHIAAVFDSRSIARSIALKQYKSSRETMPEDFIAALDFIKKIVDSLNIKSLQVEGYEADDIIGTIALQAEKKGVKVFIVSPDKDFAQLVKENISLYRPPFKGTNFEIINVAGVKKKWGVVPEKIPDYLALRGDAVDNIPGLPKIGDVTAKKLLTDFDDLDEILANTDQLKGNLKKIIEENRDEAILYKEVATIDPNVPIDFKEKYFTLKAPNAEELTALLDELEFKKLKERISKDKFYKKHLQKAEESKRTSGLKPLEKQKFELLSQKNEIEAAFKNLSKKDKCFFSFIKEGEIFNMFFCLGKQLYSFNFKNDNFPEPFLNLLDDENTVLAAFDIKPFYRELLSHKIEAKAPAFDLKVAAYVLNPEENHSLERLIATYTRKAIPEDFSREEKKALEAVLLPKLYNTILKTISGKELQLLKNIEFPLIPVLAQMELTGVKFDKFVLKEVSKKLKEESDALEQQIFKEIGTEINLRSSVQVSELLSKMLDPKKARKTVTGRVSTSEATLSEMAPHNLFARLLLRYRKLEKIISTYADSLPDCINRKTGRIHPSYNQTVTATGRLSCTNPNLQNLPIKSEEGREIRRALVPTSDEFIIVAADYSQIELRILAALSKDNTLTEAFKKGKDIHSVTASRLFDVEESGITKEMRAKSKMVNYGIAYGLSAFGLSQNLKISQAEAKEIIENYFLEFPGIRAYIDDSIESAKTNGYTETFLGRRRYLSHINSGNATVRKAEERIAINAPIQGLSADIIKLAMVKLQDFIRTEKLESKMILQVHDELVFEVYKPELNIMLKAIKRIMENPIDLGIPLEVNIGLGNNWMELEPVRLEKSKSNTKRNS